VETTLIATNTKRGVEIRSRVIKSLCFEMLDNIEEHMNFLEYWYSDH
jgi:hypothetical protein